MDQDAFRQLLKTASPKGPSSPSGISQHKKKITISASQPAFLPRKVKKTIGSDYRDRASERRAGLNEYEKIESVLHDFEKVTERIEDKEEVERTRQYLGGDKDHAILVKGLDFALFEQNKAKLAQSTALEEDNSLEFAFRQRITESTIPKKRTREDIIRDLKRERVQGIVDTAGSPPAPDPLERAKSLGKFKPIGASVSNRERQKKNQKPTDEKPKKVKRKIDAENVPSKPKALESLGTATVAELVTSDPEILNPLISKFDTKESAVVQVEVEKPDDNFDIFADVEEYKGLEVDGDEDDQDVDSEGDPPVVHNKALEVTPPTTDHKWFGEDEAEALISMPEQPVMDMQASSSTDLKPQDEFYEERIEKEVKLSPLASSSVPSIRDLLAMDAVVEAKAKHKARKEKKKAKKEVSATAKLDKDYKKLNSYMTKKD